MRPRHKLAQNSGSQSLALCHFCSVFHYWPHRGDSVFNQVRPLISDFFNWTFLLRPTERGYGETSERLPRRSLGVGGLTFAFLCSGASLHTFPEFKLIEVCILNVGHSRSRARASYPSCVTAYPRGSCSRVFSVIVSHLALAKARSSNARWLRDHV